MGASNKRENRKKARNADFKQTGKKRASKNHRSNKQNQYAANDCIENYDGGRVIKPKFERQRPTPLLPKTENQQHYIDSLYDNTITIATGSAGCVDKDTEFLSQDGWKKISEYSEGDKVMQVNQMGLEATLVDPDAYIKKPCDWFYAIESERGSINQCLSPEHNVAYTVKSKTRLNKINIEEAMRRNDINTEGFIGKVPCVYDYSDGWSIGLSKDMIRLGVALKADGSLQTESTGYYVVRLKKERKKDRLREILDGLQYDYKTYEQEHTGYTIFILYAPWCSKYLSDWMMCDKEDAQVIMEEYKFWDGEVNPSGNRMSRFSTTIKSEADALQYFANICGFRANINVLDRVGGTHVVNGKEYQRKSVEYNVTVSTRTHIQLLPKNNKTGEKNKPKVVISEDGYKYCFTVPSGFLVLRRNDCVFITGNSGKTYIPAYKAAELYCDGLIDKIFITRPYAHLGVDYGATPGTDFEKLAGFVRPMLDTLKKAMGEGKYNYCIDNEIIEVSPLEKIQGRSFDERCVIICDEAQNATRPQLVSLVTRIGEDIEYLSICGDPRQSIRNGYNALDFITDFLERNKISDVGVIRFLEEDCVRSGIVREILIALDKEGGFYADLQKQS